MIKFDIKDEKTKEDILHALVFQALGAGSMCWTHIEKAGVFKSSDALEIGHALIEEMRARGLLKV